MRSKDAIDEDILIMTTRIKKAQAQLAGRKSPLDLQATILRAQAERFNKLADLLDELFEVVKAEAEENDASSPG